jgi:hypothetical protein
MEAIKAWKEGELTQITESQPWQNYLDVGNNG